MVYSLINVISYTVTNTQQISSILSRIDEIVISVSAVIIALLWIPIAMNFFSDDEEKRYSAKVKMKNATIGTIIYIMAVSGTLYSIFLYVATGA